MKSSKLSSQLTDGGAVGGAALLDEPLDFPFLSFLVHNYFRNKSIIVEKYWLPAVWIQNPAGLRRWNYLPHPSSPLSGSRGHKMRTQREGAEFYICGGSLPPPCRQLVGRQGACRPAGGRQAPSKDLCAKKI